MGLSFVEGGSEALVVVRQRKLGLEMGCDCRRGVVGLLPPERKASLAQLLGTGLWLGLVCCLSEIEVVSAWSLGMVVQKALLQPVPIMSEWPKQRLSFCFSFMLLLNLYVSLSINLHLSLCFVEVEKIKKKVLFWSIWGCHRRQKRRAVRAWDQTKRKAKRQRSGFKEIKEPQHTPRPFFLFLLLFCSHFIFQLSILYFSLFPSITPKRYLATSRLEIYCFCFSVFDITQFLSFEIYIPWKW